MKIKEKVLILNFFNVLLVIIIGMMAFQGLFYLMAEEILPVAP